MPIERVGDEIHYLKMIVGGMPGSGKTRWASTWPNVVYVDAEGRLLSVRDRKPRRWKVSSTRDLLEFKRILEQRPDIREQELDGPVETVVIDTLDEIARIVQRERLESVGHDTMQRDDYGAVKDTLGQIIRGFRNIDNVHVLFNVHLTTREDEESGRSMVWPQIEGAMRTEVFNFVDIAVVLEARAMNDPNGSGKIHERTLKSFSDPRHEWIKDHSGAIPDGFPINFEDDWERLAKAIYGEVPDLQKSVLQLAKEEEADNLARVQAVKDQLDADQDAPSTEAAAEPKPAPAVDANLEDDVAALRRRRAPKAASTPAPAPAEGASDAEAVTAEPTVDAEADAPAEATQPEASEPAVDSAPEPEPEPGPEPDTSPTPAGEPEPLEGDAPSSDEPVHIEPVDTGAAPTEEVFGTEEPTLPTPDPEPPAASPDEPADPDDQPVDAAAAVAEVFGEVEEVTESPVRDEVAELKARLAEAERKAAANAAARETGGAPTETVVHKGAEVDANGEIVGRVEGDETDAIAEREAAAAPAEDAVPQNGTPAPGEIKPGQVVPHDAAEVDPDTGLFKCNRCGALCDHEDIVEMSWVRYQEVLCENDFREEKNKRKNKAR